MKGIMAIVIAASFFAIPAAAQQDASTGKSSTAPGRTDSTPGHEKPDQGGAKSFAPGQKQLEPGGAKDIAPGSAQRKKK